MKETSRFLQKTIIINNYGVPYRKTHYGSDRSAFLAAPPRRTGMDCGPSSFSSSGGLLTMDCGLSSRPWSFVIARRNDEAILMRTLVAIVVRLLRRLKKPSYNENRSGRYFRTEGRADLKLSGATQEHILVMGSCKQICILI